MQADKTISSGSVPRAAVTVSKATLRRRSVGNAAIRKCLTSGYLLDPTETQTRLL